MQCTKHGLDCLMRQKFADITGVSPAWGPILSKEKYLQAPLKIISARFRKYFAKKFPFSHHSIKVDYFLAIKATVSIVLPCHRWRQKETCIALVSVKVSQNHCTVFEHNVAKTLMPFGAAHKTLSVQQIIVQNINESKNLSHSCVRKAHANVGGADKKLFSMEQQR